jgi:hypothetical protein
MRKTKLTNAERDRRGKGRTMDREAAAEMKRWLRGKRNKQEVRQREDEGWELRETKLAGMGYAIQIYRSKHFRTAGGNLDVPF